MTNALTIKGVKDGLLIQIPDGPWEQVQESLMATLSEQSDFLRGARLALQVDERELGAGDLGSLRTMLAEHDVTLWAVLSSNEVTHSAGADLGLALSLRSQGTDQADREASIDTEILGEEAILIKRTLRSGHSIRHPGHVTIIGDVNPGAEIIAGGNVIVWGRIRGVVHAGATGDEEALVCALDLAPTQLRIAGQISVSPSRKGKPKPECARIKDTQLIAEPWRVKREN
jgi:septum site-determining protein MinC